MPAYLGTKELTTFDANLSVKRLNAAYLGEQGVLSQPWTPEELDTHFWLDAEDPSSYTLSGNNVISITDKSANQSEIPTIQNVTFQNRAYVFGAQDVLRRIQTSDSWAEDLTSVSIFSVAKSDSLPSASMHLFDIRNPSNLTPLLDDSARSGFAFRRRNGLNQLTSTGTNAARDLNTHQFAYTYSTSDPVLRHYTDGSTTGGVAQPVGTFLGPFSLVLGSNIASNFPNLQYVGKIHEFLVLNRLVTLEERQRIEGYLAHKWNLVGQLPGGHPYKTLAPLAPWTPRRSFTDFWIDASDSSSYTQNAGSVLTISDKSNRGVNIPTVENVEIENQSFLFRDSSVIRRIQTDENFATNPVTVSIFAVAKNNDIVTNVQRMFYISQVDMGTLPLLDDSARAGFAFRRRNASNVLVSSNAEPIRDLNTHQFAYTYSNLDPVVRHYTDGSPTGATAQSVGDFTSQASLGIGNNINGVQHYIGEVKEMIVLFRRATEAERQRIEGYMAHKWGLTDALPVDHPYKVDPPY